MKKKKKTLVYKSQGGTRVGEYSTSSYSVIKIVAHIFSIQSIKNHLLFSG